MTIYESLAVYEAINLYHFACMRFCFLFCKKLMRMASTTVSRFRELGKKIVAVGRNYKYDALYTISSLFAFYTPSKQVIIWHDKESRVRFQKSSVLTSWHKIGSFLSKQTLEDK